MIETAFMLMIKIIVLMCYTSAGISKLLPYNETVDDSDSPDGQKKTKLKVWYDGSTIQQCVYESMFLSGTHTVAGLSPEEIDKLGLR